MTIGPKPISTSEEVLVAKINFSEESVPASPDTGAVKLPDETESQAGMVPPPHDEVSQAHEPAVVSDVDVVSTQDASAVDVVDEPEKPAPESAPAAVSTVAPSAEPRAPAGGRTFAISAACGAVAGAVVAVGTIMLAAAYVLPIDPRVDMVERRLAGIEARAVENAAGIERLNGDIAQAIDSRQASAASIAEQQQQTSTLREELASLKDSLAADSQRESPIFAVAVSQLRAAFIAGASFETELVNVYSLAKQDSAMVATLTELLGPARTGVPNAAALRRTLDGIVAATPGLRLGGPQSYYEYGLALVNEYVGYAPTPYAVEFANSALNDADRHLARGDVTGAVAVLADVDPSIQRSLEPFLEEARLHQRVDAVISGINERVVADLRERKGA